MGKKKKKGGGRPPDPPSLSTAGPADRGDEPAAAVAVTEELPTATVYGYQLLQRIFAAYYHHGDLDSAISEFTQRFRVLLAEITDTRSFFVFSVDFFMTIKIVEKRLFPLFDLPDILPRFVNEHADFQSQLVGVLLKIASFSYPISLRCEGDGIEEIRKTLLGYVDRLLSVLVQQYLVQLGQLYPIRGLQQAERVAAERALANMVSILSEHRTNFNLASVNAGSLLQSQLSLLNAMFSNAELRLIDGLLVTCIGQDESFYEHLIQRHRETSSLICRYLSKTDTMSLTNIFSVSLLEKLSEEAVGLTFSEFLFYAKSEFKDMPERLALFFHQGEGSSGRIKPEFGLSLLFTSSLGSSSEEFSVAADLRRRQRDSLAGSELYKKSSQADLLFVSGDVAGAMQGYRECLDKMSLLLAPLPRNHCGQCQIIFDAYFSYMVILRNFLFLSLAVLRSAVRRDILTIQQLWLPFLPDYSQIAESFVMILLPYELPTEVQRQISIKLNEVCRDLLRDVRQLFQECKAECVIPGSAAVAEPVASASALALLPHREEPKAVSLAQAMLIFQQIQTILQGQIVSLLFGVSETSDRQRVLVEIEGCLMTPLKYLAEMALKVKFFCSAYQVVEEHCVVYGNAIYPLPAFIRARIELQIKLISILLRSSNAVLMAVSSSREANAAVERGKIYPAIIKLIRKFGAHYISLIYARYGDETDGDMEFASQDFSAAKLKLIEILDVFSEIAEESLPRDLVVFKRLVSSIIVEVQTELFHHMLTMTSVRAKESVRGSLLVERTFLLSEPERARGLERERAELVTVRARCTLLSSPSYAALLTDWKKANTFADTHQFQKALYYYFALLGHVKTVIGSGIDASIAANILSLNICQAALKQILCFVLLVVEQGQLEGNQALLSSLLSNVTETLEKMALSTPGASFEVQTIQDEGNNLLLLVKIVFNAESERVAEEAGHKRGVDYVSAEGELTALLERSPVEKTEAQIELLMDLINLARLQAIAPGSYQEALLPLRQQCRDLLFVSVTSALTISCFLKRFHTEVMKQLISFGKFPLQLSEASKQHAKFQLELIKTLIVFCFDVVLHLIHCGGDSISQRRAVFGEVDFLLRLAVKQYLFLLQGVDKEQDEEALQQVWLESNDYLSGLEAVCLESLHSPADSTPGLSFQLDVFHQIILNAQLCVLNETILFCRIMKIGEARMLVGHREPLHRAIDAFHERADRMPLSDLLDEEACKFLAVRGLQNFRDLIVLCRDQQNSSLYREVLKRLTREMCVPLVFSDRFTDLCKLESHYEGAYQVRMGFIKSQSELYKTFRRAIARFNRDDYSAGFRLFYSCLESIAAYAEKTERRILFDIYCSLQIMVRRMMFQAVVVKQKLPEADFAELERRLPGTSSIFDVLLQVNHVLGKKVIVLKPGHELDEAEWRSEHLVSMSQLLCLSRSPQVHVESSPVAARSASAETVSVESRVIARPLAVSGPVVEKTKEEEREERLSRERDRAKRREEQAAKAEASRRRQAEELEERRLAERLEREAKAERERVEEERRREKEELDRAERSVVKRVKKDQKLLVTIRENIRLSDADLLNRTLVSEEGVEKVEKRYVFARRQFNGIKSRLSAEVVIALTAQLDLGDRKVAMAKEQIGERKRLAIEETQRREELQYSHFKMLEYISIRLSREALKIMSNRSQYDLSDYRRILSSHQLCLLKLRFMQSLYGEEMFVSVLRNLRDAEECLAYLRPKVEVIEAVKAFFKANPEIARVFDRYKILLTGGAIADIYYVYKTISDLAVRQCEWQKIITDLDCICPQAVSLESLRESFDQVQLIYPVSYAPTILKGVCGGYLFDIRQAQRANIFAELTETDITLSGMAYRNGQLISPAGLESLYRRQVSMFCSTQEEITRRLVEDPYRLWRMMKKDFKCKLYDSLAEHRPLGDIYAREKSSFDETLKEVLSRISGGELPSEGFKKAGFSYGRFIGAFLQFFSEGTAKHLFESATREALFHVFFNLIEWPAELLVLKTVLLTPGYYPRFIAEFSRIDSFASVMERKYALVELLMRWMIFVIPDKAQIAGHLGAFLNVAVGMLVCQSEGRSEIENFYQKRNNLRDQMVCQLNMSYCAHPDIQFKICDLLHGASAGHGGFYEAVPIVPLVGQQHPTGLIVSGAAAYGSPYRI